MHRIQCQIFILGLLLCSTTAHAQYEWWPIKPGQVSYYQFAKTNLNQHIPNGYFGIAITDSLSIGGNKQYSFNKFITNNLAQNPSECYFIANSSPLGIKLLANDTFQSLFSGIGMEFRFNHKAPIGDSVFIHSTSDSMVKWIMVLSAKRLDSIWGIIDSIIVYQIRSNIDSSLYDSVVLSKNFGLTRTPAIRTVGSKLTQRNLFADWDNSGMLKLVGNTAHPNNPIEKITLKDCFDFQSGDKFHIRETKVTRNDYYPTFKIFTTTEEKVIKQLVLQRIETKDSVIYTIQNEVYTGTEVKSDDYWKFEEKTTVDTIHFYISSAADHTDSLPGTFSSYNVQQNTFSNPVHLQSYSYNQLPSIEMYPMWHIRQFSIYDTCWDEIPDATPEAYKTYVKKLGGPYFTEYRYHSTPAYLTYEYERKLIYYSNSKGEWGIPYSFPLGVEEKSKFQINVFPNPANEIINIQHTKQSAFMVYNLQGELIEQGNISAYQLHPISCAQWAKGIYLIKFISDADVQVQKIFLE